MRYDVCLVGAGLSGLAAATRLAHFGRRVCLVEAHTRVGGYNSWYRRGGREFSVGLHAFTNAAPPGTPGSPLDKLRRQLRLKPDDLRLAPQTGSAIRFPSATLRFDNDPATLRSEVARAFPREIDAFDRFAARLAATDEQTYDHVPASARAVMGAYIRDPLLADMLMCAPLFYGSPAGADMDWLLFCVVWKCLFASGLAWPEGGMRPLLERLEARIRADGGDIRLGCRVEALAVRDREVTAARVRAADGAESEIEAGAFLSSAGRVETLALCSDRAPEERARDAREAGTTTLVELLACLDADPAELGMPETTVFYSTEDALAFGAPDGLWEPRSGVWCAPNHYAHAAPMAEGTVRLSALASYDAWQALRDADASRARYAEAKRDVERAMLARAAEQGLDLRGRTTFTDLFTPVTLARYTGHARGALYGSPVKARTGDIGYRNLFLMGADQGFHGIVGALLSGVAMANRHGLGKK